MTPELIVIEDRIVVHQNLLPEIMNSGRYSNRLVIDLFKSRPIVPELDKGQLLKFGLPDIGKLKEAAVTFTEQYVFLGGDSVPENVILTVDLFLEGSSSYASDLWEQLRTEHGITPEKWEEIGLLGKHTKHSAEDLWAGVFLALKAISNRHIKKLLIFLATGAGGIEVVYDLLEARIREQPIQNRKIAREKSISWVFLKDPNPFVEYLIDSWAKQFASNGFASHVDLARDLLEIHCLGLGHPDFPHEVIDGIIGREIFSRPDGEGLLLHKALFHTSEIIAKNEEESKAMRLFPVQDLIRYASLFGIEVSNEEGIPVRDTCLPFAPGAMFLVNLFAFVLMLTKREIEIEFSGGELRMGMQLDDSRCFANALLHNPGGLGTRFIRLITCSFATISECPMIKSYEKNHLLQLIPLRKARYWSSNGHNRPRVEMDWDFDHEKNKVWIHWPG